MEQPRPPDAAASTVAALAAFLARMCVGERRADDPHLAVHLVERLWRTRDTDTDSGAPADGSADVAATVLGAVAGAVWAAFPGLLGEPDDAAWGAAAACARSLGLAERPSADQLTLAAAALGLLARVGRVDRPAVELVRAANWARHVEQHALAAWCARQALERDGELGPRDRAAALLVLAVATRDRQAVEGLYTLTPALDPDDELRTIAEALWPSLHPDGRLEHMEAAGAAILAEDRRTAADLLRRDIDALRARMTDDDMLRGLSAAYAALAAPDLDAAALRSGLALLIGHVRDRQRFGQSPPPAQAGIDLLLSLLTIRPASTEAEILVEVMDGLADAGLPELVAGRENVSAGDDGLAAELLQADIARLASRSDRWPDITSLIDGLRGCPALLLRRRRSTGAPGFVAVHLRPPDGLAIKNRALPTTMEETLRAFASTAAGTVVDVPDRDLDALVEHLLPGGLRADVAAGVTRRLVIVPDDDLWHVPWASSTVLRGVDIGVMPSLAQCDRTPARPPGSVTSVLAIVDDDAPGAAPVVDALHAARAAGRLRVTHRTDIPVTTGGTAHDLLLFYGHGSGSGLGYRLATARGRRTALTLARSGGFGSALIAACWSAGAPPPGLTTSLPAALLTAGVAPVIGGAWPLPGLDTGRVVAATVERLTAGEHLVAALRSVLATTVVSPQCRRGLVVHGAPAAPA